MMQKYAVRMPSRQFESDCRCAVLAGLKYSAVAAAAFGFAVISRPITMKPSADSTGSRSAAANST